MLYTLESVKANIRNREGKRVFFLGKGDHLTSAAKEFLAAERIEVLDPKQAKPEAYRLLNGGLMTQKPEYMTHLNGDVLVSKTHPRIRFRGAVDTLEAELLLCQRAVAPEMGPQVQEILDLARKLIRCDVMDEPVGSFTLCGLSEQEQRKHSHFPQEYYGQPHFMPSAQDGQEILQLNRARCAARQAELMATEAFMDKDGIPVRTDILQALNRMSSMLYILMIRLKAKK